MQRPMHNVLLPPRFWEVAAGDKAKLKALIAGYMKTAYPDYVLKAVKKNDIGSFMGVCERK